jgi:hypothetical protein
VGKMRERGERGKIREKGEIIIHSWLLPLAF